MSHKLLEFRESLTSSDYGLIVGDQGELKGIWIPEGSEQECIPQSIVNICVAKFGIDPNSNGHSAVLQ